MVIPKLPWALLVYEIFSTTVEARESKINMFTRMWLGVPPGLTDVAMNCRKAKLRYQYNLSWKNTNLAKPELRLNEDSRKIQKAV